MEKDLQVVGFRIGNETYGVRIASVREIVRVPEITSVPSAPDLIEGVINLRGKIIPVMDLRKRFGQAEIQPDNKDRIQRRLKACQLDSFYSYYRLLTSREGRAELALLLENLTVNETSFFRNKPQLELLQKSVLEDLLRRKQERRDYALRVWSAGCS